MTPCRKRTILALATTLFLSCAGQALAVGDDPVLKRMDTVLEENNRLREESWKARSHGKEAAARASEAYEASENRLEKARAEALAHVAGVSQTQVETMRKDGKSWGQTAGELGVHPGFLGIGKVPMYEPAKVRRAMAKAEAKKLKRGAKGKAAEVAEAPVKGKAGKKAKAEPKAEGKTKAKAEAAEKPHKKAKKKRAE